MLQLLYLTIAVSLVSYNLKAFSFSFSYFQILNVKPQHFPHKSKLGLTSGTSNLCASTANKTNKEDRKVRSQTLEIIVNVLPTSGSLTHFDSFFNRKVYVREPAKPFVSMAEMMRKFQSSTKDMSLPHVNDSTLSEILVLLIASFPILFILNPFHTNFRLMLLLN